MTLWQRLIRIPIRAKALEVSQDRFPVRRRRQELRWICLVVTLRLAPGTLGTERNEIGMGDRQHLIGEGSKDVARWCFWRSMAPHHSNRPSITIGAAVVGANETEDASGILCPLVCPEGFQDRPHTLLNGIPARESGTGEKFRQPYTNQPPSGGQDIGGMGQHRLFQMAENRRRHVRGRLASPPRYILVIKIGIAGTDRRQIGNRSPFPEGCLRHV